MVSLLRGLGLVVRHLFSSWRRRQGGKPFGIVTVPYPHEHIAVPENGHYRLHVEIEDCIGCDLCARVCPVKCITIRKEKSPQLLGRASNGAPRRFYLPQFDIDHALCCFCGLCTIVCPTECITMEPVYAYATTNRADLVLHFGDGSRISPNSPEYSGGA
ncbi:MAG: 4Fe-4S dicluster domain-containing protein [Bacteroidia bacterium]|nr:4Fe-4S dicluster domain-containing protein [Bacteroidia bacterium]MDW8134004.1 4Fe-4S dicluster domain-containing protein [Bacteroidia bacterium]